MSTQGLRMLNKNAYNASSWKHILNNLPMNKAIGFVDVPNTHAFLIVRRQHMEFYFYDQNGAPDALEPWLKLSKQIYPDSLIQYAQQWDLNPRNKDGLVTGTTCLNYVNYAIWKYKSIDRSTQMPIGGWERNPNKKNPGRNQDFVKYRHTDKELGFHFGPTHHPPYQLN